MKKIFLIALLASLQTLSAQDTFSIVALDSTTREVGSAGASCVDLFQFGIIDGSFLGDLIPDTGSINTQAAYVAANQNNARARMRAGDTPAQMVTWLTANDVGANPSTRQYGIVGFNGNNPSAEGYTGSNCQNYKNHIKGNFNGIYYCIQGNILLGQLVLDSMEARFKNAQGDLACRLMAALQGAKMVGADTRCTSNGTSSLFAFIKVAQKTDPYNNPSLKLYVKTVSNAQIEPIDSLQTVFSAQHACTSSGINENSPLTLKIFPNPATNQFIIETGSSEKQILLIYDYQGRLLNSQTISGKSEILIDPAEGVYTLTIETSQGRINKKLVIIK